jgi:hypothetical protein
MVRDLCGRKTGFDRYPTARKPLGQFSSKAKRQALLFLGEKEAKRLLFIWAWGIGVFTPQAQIQKIFAPLFLKSGHLLILPPPSR